MTRRDQTFNSVNVTNPFLVARLVFFAISAYLTVLLLIFAAWNIHATTTIGLKAPLGTVFLLFNACVNLLCLIIGVVEIAVPAFKVSNVTFECVWSATTGLLQTGLAIITSIYDRRLFCGLKDHPSCAPVSLLMPVTWLNSVILLSYFSTLLITIVAHSNAHPNIWTNSVYDIDWFGYLSARRLGASGKGYSECADELSRRRSVAMGDLEKAPWATTTKVRRGIDPPFAKDKKPGAKAHSTPIPAPTIPLRVHGKVSNGGSRFVEVTNQNIVGPRFPSTLDNHDLPIAITKRSEWVRADFITDESR